MGASLVAALRFAMAELASHEAPGPTIPHVSPRRLLLARVRQWTAVVVLGLGAVAELSRQLQSWSTPSYHFDPAWMFYFAGATGLALRVFWARYLAICFCSAIMAVTFFYGPTPASAFAFGVPFIALLAGRTMRALFEENPGWLNRWANRLDARVARLRVLFVAQSVAVGLLWAAGDRLSPLAMPLSVAAGVSLVGLVLLQVWGALAIAPLIAAQIYVATQSIGLHPHRGEPPGWAFTAVLFAACALSLVVIAPLLRASFLALRSAVRASSP